MILDDFLLLVIMAGCALAGAYLKAGYALRVRSKAAQRNRTLALHGRHVATANLEQNGISVRVRIVHAPSSDQTLQRQSSLQQQRLKPA